MQSENADNTERLIRSAQEGDKAAFTELVSEYYDQMYRYALKLSGHVSDAEDITQQACLKLAKSIHQFRFESAFSTWLYRLVTNCGKDWFRAAANRQHDEFEEVLNEGESSPPDSVIQLNQVLRQVEDFGEGFRETIVLVLGEGLSHREAGEILGVKESTISWRIHETRKRLVAGEAKA